MSIVIRQAQAEDAPRIAEIIQLAFDETTSVSQIQKSLNAGNRCYVAELNNQIVGFVEGFITYSAEGERRNELDLLAVHPDYHGQGIGTKIIDYYTHANYPADFIRALIAVGNIRMEKALTRLGYQVSSDVCGLYVSSATTQETSKTPQDSHLIPITTFTYDGIWLEGQITQQAINSAMSLKNHKDDVIGAVVPLAHTDTIKRLQSADFNLITHYRRWQR